MTKKALHILQKLAVEESMSRADIMRAEELVMQSKDPVANASRQSKPLGKKK
jgi:hypothetical protein